MSIHHMGGLPSPLFGLFLCELTGSCIWLSGYYIPGGHETNAHNVVDFCFPSPLVDVASNSLSCVRRHTGWTIYVWGDVCICIKGGVIVEKRGASILAGGVVTNTVIHKTGWIVFVDFHSQGGWTGIMLLCLQLVGSVSLYRPLPLCPVYYFIISCNCLVCSRGAYMWGDYFILLNFSPFLSEWL